MPWVWSGWEMIWLRLHPVTPVRPGALFGTRTIDGTLELHLDGRVLARMRRQPGYSTFRTLHQLREEMGVIAARVRAGELRDVRMIRGTSLVGRVGGVLGFDVRPLPHTIGNALQQYFMVGLDAVYHPLGLRERAKQRWPAETRMAVEELLRRY